MSKLKLDYNKIRNLEKNNDNISFNEIPHELNSILQLLDNTEDKSIERHLKNYIIIRLSTLLEVFFSQLCVNLIDNYGASYEELFKDNTISLSISNIDNLKEITKGQIIVTSLHFQNKKEIFDNMTIILSKSFSNILKSINTKNDKNPYIENWDKFFEIFEERHKIVHTSQKTEKYNTEQVKDLVDASQWLTTIVNVTAFEPIYKNQANKLEKNNPFIFKWFSQWMKKYN